MVEWHMFWDNVAQVPFLKRGAAWISFDSLRSIYAKISHHFGPILPRGVMLTGLRLDNYDASCTKESGQVSLLGLIQGMMRLPKKYGHCLPKNIIIPYAFRNKIMHTCSLAFIHLTSYNSE